MIRFAHPFGAVLRTFSALRAPSGLRRNDDGICLTFSTLQPISPIANALDMTNTPGVMHVNRALHISLTHIEILLISFD